MLRTDDRSRRLTKHFRKFDEEIRLGRFEESEVLRDKRDKVLTQLQLGFERQRKNGKAIPTYTTRDQGSYALGLGVKPIDGDYDIDVGLFMELAIADHPDPTVVKQWVLDAVDGHTKRVEMRKSCVTVFYQIDGEPVYHVDLAVFSALNADGITYLAKGMAGSQQANKKWQASDPKAFQKLFENKWADDDAQQFRRVIRCLKRWKLNQFAYDGNAAPPGIALAACAFDWFKPVSVVTDSMSNAVEYDDAAAMKNLVDLMLANFRDVSTANGLENRLSIQLPVEPRNDLFGKMTAKQMEAFKQRLSDLQEALGSAQDEVDEREACKMLNLQLGDPFPVPDASSVSKPRSRAIVSSGESA